MPYDISALPAYTNQQSRTFVTRAILGAATIALLTQFGAFDPTAKGAEAIQILDTDVVVQDGTNCGRNPVGGAVLSQAVLTVKLMKVNQNYCVKVLTTTWAVEELKATMKGLPYDKMAFQQDIGNLNADKLADKIEKIIWLSDPANNALETSLKLIPGFIKQIKAATHINLNPGAAIEIGDDTSIITIMRNAYKLFPVQVRTQKDFRFLIGQDWADAIVSELADKNLFKQAENNTLFGTLAKYEVVPGLNGTNVLWGGKVSHLRAGGEMTEGKFTGKYSDETEQYYMDSNFSLGVVPILTEQMGLGEYPLEA